MSVKTIQEALIAVGYNIGKVDGIAGEKTTAAALDAIRKAYPHPVKVSGPGWSFAIPSSMLPDVPMKRIINHWTGGAYVASDTDKEHYHFLIEGDLDVVRGKHSIADNVSLRGKSSDDYAAHTLNSNTGSIGNSVCCMGGARENPFNPGRFPMLKGQWDLLIRVNAQQCIVYDIPVTDKTVLTHAEVQANLGIAQRGKWDYTRLPFLPGLVGARAIGDKLRQDVQALINQKAA